MHVHTLSVQQGARWLFDSFKIYGKAQLRLPLIIISYLMLMMVLLLFGLPGLLLILLCDPIFSVSLANLARSVDQGKKVDPGIIFSGFFKKPVALLAMGVVYLCAVIAVVFLAFMLFGAIYGDALSQEIVATLMSQAETAERLDKEQLARLMGPLSNLFKLILILKIPPSVLFWNASALVAWHDFPKGKALFFSLVGCLRNWGAFLAYVVVFIAAALLIPNFALKLLADYVNIGIKNLLILSFVFFSLALTLWYLGLYVSHRAIFTALDETA